MIHLSNFSIIDRESYKKLLGFDLDNLGIDIKKRIVVDNDTGRVVKILTRDEVKLFETVAVEITTFGEAKKDFKRAVLIEIKPIVKPICDWLTKILKRTGIRGKGDII